MIIDNKFTVRHKILTGNIDGKCRATPMEFAILLQELAAGHYGTTGLSIPHLQKMGMTWVITKQHFEIAEYPLWMDDLIVQTWAQPPKGFFCFRDFAFFYARNGKKASIDDAFEENLSIEEEREKRLSIEEFKGLSKPFFRASSCWVILNSETGQPIKPDERTMGNLAFNDEHLEGKVFAKITLPEKWETEEKIQAYPFGHRHEFPCKQFKLLEMDFILHGCRFL
nr:acyl-ACP thioesterase domain-containing protein [Treponema sp. OMZ 788]